MPDIVLTTLNAKFIHAAFGLRYLFANLGDLQPRAVIAEFDINLRPLDIAEALLAQLERRAPSRLDESSAKLAGTVPGAPPTRIIGFGIYIWNVAETTEVIAAIKRVRPEIKIILGGPEVSYETEGQKIVELADHVITGEADLKFAEVCRQLLVGRESSRALTENPGSTVSRPTTDLPKIIPAELPEFSRIALPYDLYTDDDLARRMDPLSRLISDAQRPKRRHDRELPRPCGKTDDGLAGPTFIHTWKWSESGRIQAREDHD